MTPTEKLAARAPIMRAICGIGERCSCADGNHQWRDQACEVVEQHATLIVATGAYRALPSEVDRLRTALSQIMQRANERPGGGGMMAERETVYAMNEIARAALLSPRDTDQPTNAMAHASDCAIHSAPALPVGPCDCGAESLSGEPAPGATPSGSESGCSQPLKTAPTYAMAPQWGALVEFSKWAIETSAWCGTSLDGSEVQDEALKLGLIVETKYDPEKHGDSENSEYAEPGDQWFVFADWLKTPSRSSGLHMHSEEK